MGSGDTTNPWDVRSCGERGSGPREKAPVQLSILWSSAGCGSSLPFGQLKKALCKNPDYPGSWGKANASILLLTCSIHIRQPSSELPCYLKSAAFLYRINQDLSVPTAPGVHIYHSPMHLGVYRSFPPKPFPPLDSTWAAPDTWQCNAWHKENSQLMFVNNYSTICIECLLLWLNSHKPLRDTYCYDFYFM